MKPRRLGFWWVVAILLVVGWTTSVWGTPAPLTLGEALLLALQENPGLKAAGYSVPAAEAQVARARARFLPRINFFESFTHSDNPAQVFTSKLNQRRFSSQDFLLDNLNFPQPYSNFRSGLVANQPVFQAGEAYLGYQQSRLKKDIAAAQVLARRQQLIYQVTKAYFGRQLAEAGLEVVREAKNTAAANRCRTTVAPRNPNGSTRPTTPSTISSNSSSQKPEKPGSNRPHTLCAGCSTSPASRRS